MGLYCNAEMEPAQIQAFCPLDKESQGYLRNAIQSLHLSARAYDRILRVARTIADLEESVDIAALIFLRPFNIVILIKNCGNIDDIKSA